MYTVEWAVLGSPYVMYDGTNGADILAAVTAFYPNSSPPPSITSEADGVLTISEESNGPFVVSVGQRLSLAGGGSISPARWNDAFIKRQA
jgi:hypothetical protein